MKLAQPLRSLRSESLIGWGSRNTRLFSLNHAWRDCIEDRQERSRCTTEKRESVVLQEFQNSQVSQRGAHDVTAMDCAHSVLQMLHLSRRVVIAFMLYAAACTKGKSGFYGFSD